MNASSQENPNWLNPAGLVAVPIPAPTAPAAIKITGTFRHFDKSSGATDEDGASVFIISFLNLNPNLNLNLYFLKSARFVSGTSSAVANWLRCKART